MDVPKLRQQCRDRQFCLSLSPERFGQIIDALMVANERDLKQLIPTVSNILLLNRHLHTTYFTPHYSYKVLDFLNRYYQNADSSDLVLMIAVFRLIFLVVFDRVSYQDDPQREETEREKEHSGNISSNDGDSNKDDNSSKDGGSRKYHSSEYSTTNDSSKNLNVNLSDDPKRPSQSNLDVNTNKSHIETDSNPSKTSNTDANLEHIADLILSAETTLNQELDKSFASSRFLKDKFHEMLLVEVLKGLLTLYHNYSDLFVNIHVDKYLLTLSGMDLSKHIMVTKYIVNVLVMVCTINISNTEDCCIDQYLEQEARVFISCLTDLLTFKLLGRETDSEIEVNDFTHLLMVIDHLCTLMIKLTKVSRELKLFLFDRLFPSSNKVPAPYAETFKLLKQRHLGDLPVSQDAQIAQFQRYFVQCAYHMAQLRDPDHSTKTFLELVGYVLAKDYMDTTNIPIPADLDVNDYLNAKYAKNVDLFPASKITSALNNIMLESNQKDSQKDTQDEMTPEQKEMEAEKLFVLFDRMEKIGVFRGFKNPVREWQQLGKLEGLDS